MSILMVRDPRKRTPLHLLAAIFVLLLMVACGGNSQEEGLSVGNEAPAFTLTDQAGNTVSLADYEGQQPVLLYFHMAMG